MYIKVKHILFVFLILLLSIGIVKFIFRKNDFEDEKIIESNILVDKNYNMDYARGGEQWLELCYIVAKKNGNWSNLPLTENFRKKYNEKDGILGSIQYDNIEYRPYAGTDEDYYFRDYYTYFVITQNKLKTAYIFSPEYINDDILLNDVGIFDTIIVSDENGNKVKSYGHYFNDNSYSYCFYMLSRGEDDERSVAVTPSFHAKYPFFLDIFEHYSPLRFNHIEFVPEKSSWEKQEAYFIVDSVLECKKRYYKVKFTLDDKGYLDDVKVIKVNEEEYVGNYDEIAAKLVYENSNWYELKITDNYRKKFNGQSYNPDIKKINIDYDVKSEYVEKGNYNEYLWQYTMKDGSTSVYYIKYILDDNAYVDDIECKKIPYDNISLKEAKELYLKDKNQ